VADAHINGARIWYEVRGEGEDYLLQIGGAGFAHENFGFVTDAMTPHFKVIEFDLRGYGLSERPEQEYSMDLWADDINWLFDAIGVERAHVHGTSMGGMVALVCGRCGAHRRLVLDCASTSPTSWLAHWEV
jgi:pimeloyl-ACP methyl ester carboxylesterase